MEKKIIDGYEIRSINDDSLANYISKIFSSEIYVNIIQSFNSKDEAIRYSNDVSKIIFAYVCSTGDNYASSAYKIMKDYLNSNLNVNDFYYKYVVPMSLNKLGYSHKSVSIKQMISILEHLYLNSKNNQFFTHSFNGALYPIINKEGLNGDKELFKSEFEILSEIGDSPYQKGKLCFSSLGGHTMPYALHAPERLHMILNDPYIKIKDDESSEDYYLRCLYSKVKNFDDDKKNKILEAGKRVIDFYNSKLSCIAIMKSDYEYKKYKSFPTFTSDLYLGMLRIKNSIWPLLENNNDLRQSYEDMLASLKENEDNCLDKLIAFQIMFDQHNKNSIIIRKCLRNTFKKTILEKCLNNFTYDSFGDGMIAQNNKVDRFKFSIARFPNVNELYIEKYQEKNNNKVR